MSSPSVFWIFFASSACLLKVTTLPAFKTNLKTDHSSLSVIISNNNEIKPDPGLWKFNNSLISDKNFTEKLKSFIENLKEDLDSENSFNDQMKWE